MTAGTFPSSDSYITTESGTGLVHTAPGHGQDDYLTGLKCDGGRFDL